MLGNPVKNEGVEFLCEGLKNPETKLLSLWLVHVFFLLQSAMLLNRICLEWRGNVASRDCLNDVPAKLLIPRICNVAHPQQIYPCCEEEAL